MTKIEKFLALNGLIYNLALEFDVNVFTKEELKMMESKFYEIYEVKNAEDAERLITMVKDLAIKLFNEEVLEDE